MVSAADRKLGPGLPLVPISSASGMDAIGGFRDVSWVEQEDDELTPRRLHPTLHPRFAKLASGAKKAITFSTDLASAIVKNRVAYEYASMAVPACPRPANFDPKNVEWHALHELHKSASLPSLQLSPSPRRPPWQPPSPVLVPDDEKGLDERDHALDKPASPPPRPASPPPMPKKAGRRGSVSVSSSLTSTSMAVMASESLEQLARKRRNRCLDALRKPGDERTADELELLREWASRVKFGDADVQKVIDPILLCKAMRLQMTSADEILISQGEEGDAFYAIFSGVVSVYVAYGVDPEKTDADGASTNAQPAAWPAGLVNKVNARLRKVRRQEKGEIVTPDPPTRAVQMAARRQSNVPPASRRTSVKAQDEMSEAGSESSTSSSVRRGSTGRRGTVFGGNAPKAMRHRQSLTNQGLGQISEQAPNVAERRFSNRSQNESVVSLTAPSSSLRRSLIRENEAPTDGAPASKGIHIEKVFTYREYESFGDLALLFGAPRSASVVAEAGTVLVRVERADYNAVVRKAALEAVRQRASFLATLPALGGRFGLHFQALVRLSSYVKREDRPAGATILAEGHANDDVLIIQQGEAEVQRRVGKSPLPRRLLTLGVGTCVGSLPMDAHAHRALVPSLVASQPNGCVVLRLKRSEFAFRAGRRVISQLAIGEATAWLTRLHAPGPLRSLVSADDATPSSPPKPLLSSPTKGDLLRSASTPALRSNAVVGDDHSGLENIEEWLLKERESLHSSVQADMEREAIRLAKAKEAKEKEAKEAKEKEKGSPERGPKREKPMEAWEVELRAKEREMLLLFPEGI